MPKIIKVGGNLTKLWQKQFCSFFETRCSKSTARSNSLREVRWTADQEISRKRIYAKALDISYKIVFDENNVTTTTTTTVANCTDL